MGATSRQKKMRGVGLANERGEVEEKQLQFVVVAFIACLFACIIVLSHDGDVMSPMPSNFVVS